MLLLIWTVAGSNLHSTSASAQTSQTIVLKSGNGPVGSQDPVNQCAIDGNGTYQDACIVDPHPAYSVIPGTQYISSTPDSSTPVDGATRYRAIFQLPEGFSSPSMDAQVYADNVATVFVNGVQVYQQTFADIWTNFQGPASAFTVSDASLFHSGANTLEFEIYNFIGPTAFDYQATISFSTAITVAVDIKPTSCPNPMSTGEKGLLPVAILGMSGFDVTQVDPASVRLEGVAPLRYFLEDVAKPFLPLTGKTDRLDCNTEGPDGLLDLTLKFDHRTVMAALGEVVDGQVRVLRLTGNLKAEYGGVSVEGEDVTVIVKKK
jgi:hypothetical protein